MSPNRLLLPLAAVVLVVSTVLAALAAQPARAGTPQEVAITSPDGTRLATTLSLPEGTPPAGGWPAIVFLHGLAGDRAQALQIADAMGVGRQYAVLAFDARGHGMSEGLVGLDGPNELADTRAVFEWLRDHPDVSDTKIGAFGVSYGGGAVYNSLVAGVPWAAAEAAITFTDLGRALYPQNLAKSGVVAGFLLSVPPSRVDPALAAAASAAYRGDTAAVQAFATPRSSIRALPSVRTPVYVMQGRRDFAFGLDQGLPAFAALAGPKRLWIGNIGHLVSSVPGPDTPAMLADGKRWFDRFLLDDRNGVDQGRAVTIAAEGSARTTTLAAVPATRAERWGSTQVRSLARPSARGTWTLAPPTGALEVFGAPVVRARVEAAGGWSRVVAVLTSTTRAGAKVIAVGGAPVRQGTSTATIRLISQATFVPAGSKLTVTIASSSASAPGSAARTYLDLPMPEAATLRVMGVSLTLPVMQKPVSR